MVLGSLLAGQNDPSGLDFFFFRRGLYRYYACSTGLPTTLDGFLSQFEDNPERPGTLIDSVAKCGDRRVIVDLQADVYLAETLVEGEVRETEVLIGGRRSDGGLDFAFYGADG